MFNNKGFTLVELTVVTALLLVISTAGSLLMMAGQSAWSMTEANISMQENLRRSLERVSLELQESGWDSDGNLQVTIIAGAGVAGTDVLRFAIPICPCGVSPMNSDGDVEYWGAPLLWGQSGCNGDWPLTKNNKVAICHLPPGNPNNSQSINVSENAVRGHLAHGDWLGDCDDCNPGVINHRYVEYRLDANQRLVRRVLDPGLVMINEAVVAENVTAFDVGFNGGQTMVNITLELSRTASLNRPLSMAADVNILLRNRG